MPAVRAAANAVARGDSGNPQRFGNPTAAGVRLDDAVGVVLDVRPELFQGRELLATANRQVNRAAQFDITIKVGLRDWFLEPDKAQPGQLPRDG